jgi:uncharacterized ferredoxin-like protein
MDCQHCGFPVASYKLTTEKSKTFFSCPRCGQKLPQPITIGPVQEGENIPIDYKKLLEDNDEAD